MANIKLLKIFEEAAASRDTTIFKSNLNPTIKKAITKATLVVDNYLAPYPYIEFTFKEGTDLQTAAEALCKASNAAGLNPRPTGPGMNFVRITYFDAWEKQKSLWYIATGFGPKSPSIG